MSGHWREWQFTNANMNRRHRTWPAVNTHRVAVMVEAEAIPVGPRSAFSHGWTVTKPGRTVCGLSIDTPGYLSPHGPNKLIGSPYESWVIGWRPCYRCFPEFDRRTLERMVAIDHKWWSKGANADEAEVWGGRVDRRLWKIVMAHREPAFAQFSRQGGDDDAR